MTGCIENNSSNAAEAEHKEVVSTSNEIKNPPRVESPAAVNLREGDKWKLYIPYDLAYGDRGAGADIGPYSTLIFEIELISVDK